MPSELDPAYAAFRRETPSEAMRRIERDLRSPDFEYQKSPNTQPGHFAAGAGRNLEGYNATIGTQGPVGGSVIAAADPQTGRPVMVGGRLQAGPLSYTVTQPTFQGAQPSREIGIGGQPFDADAYFGVSAKQGPDGRTYGVNAGGDGWGAYGGYNPTTRGVNVGGSYSQNFADGGEVYGNPITGEIIPLDDPGIQPSVFTEAVGRDLSRLGESVKHSAMMPGQIIRGERSFDPHSDEDIQAAMELAGFAAPGAMAAGPVERGAVVLGSGPVLSRAAERELSALGLYSHGAEAAAALPQAKGSTDQMIAMLKKAGVKDAELEGVADAFAGQKSVTRDELASHFRENMPVVEERVLGGKSKVEFTPEMEARLDELTEKRISTGLTEEEMAEKNKLFGLQEEARTGVSPTKFGKYTLPGGENYREVLLKAPSEGAPIVDKKGGSYGFNDPSGRRMDYWSEEEAQQAARSFYRDSGAFKSQHWDDPNVLAHLRMSDRTGPNGEKILHVEEVQSDWGQKGKKEGWKDTSQNWDQQYKDFQNKAVNDWVEKKAADSFERNPELFGSIDQARETAQIAAKHYGMTRIAEDLGLSEAHSNLYDKMNQYRNGLPSAPYVTSTQGWTDLALKRALKEAAEGGYDKLVWTPGAEQAKRYDLSKQVSGLRYYPEKNALVYRKADADQWMTGGAQRNVTPENLSDYVGKEVAEKLLAQKADEAGIKELTGMDLSVGGEGMKAYYDSILPKRVQELARRHDKSARIERSEIPGSSPRAGKNIAESDVMDWHPESRSLSPNDQNDWWASKSPAERSALKDQYRSEVLPDVLGHSITITPAMRDSILKGQTAFAKGGEVKSDRPIVGREKAAGVEVTLEQHKGETRHRKDSGDSKMAADYGYLPKATIDHDKMKTDAFVGPHKDSDRVFVINQQHPHSKKFNEHKVMLGYNDRSHAVHDFVHSFSDGNGHKRIASIIEMTKGELKNWMRKPHDKPLKKADGGMVNMGVETVAKAAAHVAEVAAKSDINQRQLAYLLKVASGMYMPPDRAMDFAGQIMNGDVDGLMQRFAAYKPSARTFARLNQMLDGKHQVLKGDHMGDRMKQMKGEEGFARTKQSIEGAMESDVIKSNPTMKKALSKIKERI